MPLISVIIPVYNAEKYLRKCLDSVVSQTLTDIEVICVDDCSTDGSLRILREYEKNDPRVRVIHCEQNNRQAVARNIGMSVATGKYIGFVDNDDWIDSDRYEKLYKAVEEEKADIALAGSVDVYENGCVKLYNRHTESRKVLGGVTFLQKLVSRKILAGEVWNAIYSFKLIKEAGLKFQSIRVEDFVFNLEAAAHAKTVCLTPDCGYHYVYRSSSDKWGDEERSFYKVKGIESCVSYLRKNTLLKNVISSYDSFINNEILFAFCETILNTSSIMTHRAFHQKCKAVRELLASPLLQSAFADKGTLKGLPIRHRLVMEGLQLNVPLIIAGLSVREYVRLKYHAFRGWTS